MPGDLNSPGEPACVSETSGKDMSSVIRFRGDESEAEAFGDGVANLPLRSLVCGARCFILCAERSDELVLWTRFSELVSSLGKRD